MSTIKYGDTRGCARWVPKTTLLDRVTTLRTTQRRTGLLRPAGLFLSWWPLSWWFWQLRLYVPQSLAQIVD